MPKIPTSVPSDNSARRKLLTFTQRMWLELGIANPLDLDDSILTDCPDNLSQDHYRKLKGSGLSLPTIEAAQIYTEYDTDRLREMLRSSSPEAPAMVLPGFDRLGKQNGYDVARMMPPHIRYDGSEAKYLMPTGLGCRAYFPPLPVVSKAVKSPGVPLLITEGIFKALAASQAGVPCIGLMGVWNWCLKRTDKSKPRELIPDLERIDWPGRIVLIVFDSDRERKPGVNQAAAELARILREHGADVRIVRLPLGPRIFSSKPVKQAIDDYIARLAYKLRSQSAAKAQLRQWVQEQLATPPFRPLDDWRENMQQARFESLAEPGIYLDRSPTGVGKSHATGSALKAMAPDARSLSLQPTHLNCEQTQRAYAQQGINAVTYPKLDQNTCARFDEASEVRGQGLSFQSILCPECPFAGECEYRISYADASQSQHAIATHKRGEIHMPGLTNDRRFITVDENPLDMLSPICTVDDGLEVIEFVARKAEMICPDPIGRLYLRCMQRNARQLNGWLEGSNETEMITPMPARAKQIPKNPDADLYRAIQRLGLKPVSGEAMKLVRAVTDGELDELCVKFEERYAPGGKTRPVRSLVGRMKTNLPANATVWINDATANPQSLKAVLGRSIEDRTPPGSLERQHPVLQVPRDVTRSTSADTAAEILRGMLHDLPYRRVGVLTHKPLLDQGLLDKLEPEYRDRVAMVEYFGGGQSRGSNDWIEACDALVVLGTPRVPPHSIRDNLIQLGQFKAVKMTEEQAGWSPDWWSAMTESGNRVTVRSLHYTDHDWHAAYVSIVQAELIQAIGRARSYNVNGIPAYLVSTENMAPLDHEDGRNGIPIADRPFAPLTNPQSAVLRALHDDRGDPVRRKTSQIKKLVGKSRNRVLVVLRELERDGRVQRIGKAGGWVTCPKV